MRIIAKLFLPAAALLSLVGCSTTRSTPEQLARQPFASVCRNGVNRCEALSQEQVQRAAEVAPVVYVPERK